MLCSLIEEFIKDETGAVTVDAVVVIGGSMLMGQTIVMDVSRGVMSLSDRMDARLEAIGDDYLPGGQYYPGNAQPTSGTGGETGGNNGNPGNDKNVGNAGENPNGQGGWGGGSNGMSDGDKSNNGNGRGNGNNG